MRYDRLLLPVLVFLGLSSCSRPQPETAIPDRIFLLGVDTLSYERIEPLLRSGELPNIRKILDGGVRLDATPSRPMEPVSAWTTLLTGKDPEQHKMLGHIGRIATGETAINPSRIRGVPHIWQLLSMSGVLCVGVGFPGTWPAETINGFLVSNAYTPNRWMETAENTFLRVEGLAETYPRLLFDEIQPYVHDGEIPREVVSRFFVLREEEYAMVYDEPLGSIIAKDNPLKDFAITYQADMSNMDVGLYLQETYSPRFVGIYMETVQALQSAFWSFTQPDLYGTPPESNRRFRNTVDEGYRLVDAQIGRILERMTERSVLIVASQFGFGTDYPPPGGEHENKPYAVAKDPAVLMLYGHGIRDGVHIEEAKTADVVPTILCLFGKDVATDMAGSVLVNALEPSFLEAHPTRVVRSYDTDWPGPDRYPNVPGLSERFTPEP